MPLPPALVTATLPEVPYASTAVILVADVTVNEAAAVPPNVTLVVPVKLEPLMVMVAPAAACVGLKLEITGAWAIDACVQRISDSMVKGMLFNLAVNDKMDIVQLFGPFVLRRINT